MASWLTSKLKAAEQFLNQIDATAADRAARAKEQGLGSDTEGTGSRYGPHFSRTASELSFTDGNLTPAESGDESTGGGLLPGGGFTSRTAVSREKDTPKSQGPAAADWTELLGGARDRLGNGVKLLRTKSNVSPVPARIPRFSKKGGGVAAGVSVPQPPPRALVKAPEGLNKGGAITPEESTGSAEKGSLVENTEAASRRGSDQSQNEASSNMEVEGENGPNGREGEGVNKGAGNMDGQEEVSTSTAVEGVHIGANLSKQKARHKKGMIRNNSGLEAVIPTSDSEEEKAVVPGGGADEKEVPASGIAESQAGPVSEEQPRVVKSEGLPPELEENLPEAENSVELVKLTTESPAEMEPLPAIDSAPNPQEGQNAPSTPPEDTQKVIATEGGPEIRRDMRDFSMRSYMGRDLSVKNIETDGIDSNEEDSESGTDEETDSDSDDSENERAAEAQRQKEEAERQAAERQKATIAAAALEETAAETAARAVKEREEVVALLEKEKEELQVEAADASEKHAKEIARLRATATAGSKAAHVEKSSHSSTRMETYSKEEQLVIENIEKAKALAAAQRALEEVVARALEVRRKVDERELHHAGLRKRLAEAQEQLRRLQEGPETEPVSSAQAESLLREELERVEEEVRRKKQRVVELEARLRASAGQKREPSERERELERRLQSLTDHLIQKQAQVESLASERATLALRLETVSSSLHEEEEKVDGPFRKRSKQSRHGANEWWLEDDLEYGSPETSKRGGRGGRRHSFESDDSDDDDSKKHKGSILPGVLVTGFQWFDSLTFGGGRFLRFNTPARVLLALYLLLLHAWVLLVWSIHSGSISGGGGQLVESGLAGVNQAVANSDVPSRLGT